jgi:hypothetical protein
MLPNIFGADFGVKIHRFVFLTDPKNNQFEVYVERTNRWFFFSKGWKALKDLVYIYAVRHRQDFSSANVQQ